LFFFANDLLIKKRNGKFRGIYCPEIWHWRVKDRVEISKSIFNLAERSKMERRAKEEKKLKDISD